jgi:hypothetical protein
MRLSLTLICMFELRRKRTAGNEIALKVPEEEETLKKDKETTDCEVAAFSPVPMLSRRQFSTLVAAAAGTLAVTGPASLAAAEAGVAKASDGSVSSVPFGVGPCWPHELGDVRALVSVPQGHGAVRVHIPWRRRDANPEAKEIIVQDSKTGKTVENVSVIAVNREFADIAFEPSTASGTYEIYYMPYTIKPRPWDYSVSYGHAEPHADDAWLASNGLTAAQLDSGQWKTLPQANVKKIEARMDFDRFDPMEVIATQDETNKLAAMYPGKPFLLFPQDRQFPIRMTGDLPLRWIQGGPRESFRGTARRGEFFVFQVGIYASRSDVQILSIASSELKTDSGSKIPASAIRCFNLGGTDWLGREFSKNVAISQGKIGALWFGTQIPKELVGGTYQGTLVIRTHSGETRLALTLVVEPQLLEDAGDSELWRQSRLRWLDSTLGIDDELTAPYTPLTVNERTVGCLGREVRFDGTGLPASIRSNGREVLNGEIKLLVETTSGIISWTGGFAKVQKSKAGVVTWEASKTGGEFALRCEARMEFDGHIDFDIRVRVNKTSEVNDIRLEVPFQKDVAPYMMGLGRKGGYRPKEWKSVWDINRNIDSVWIGDYNAGLQLKLKGPEDAWDLYDLKLSGIPKSWGNEGNGGWTVSEEQDRVLVKAYSGERVLNPGTELQFRFALLVTPVKPLDRAHWSQRYYHILGAPEDAAQCGASIINVHQGNELNPYINYPFLAVDKLSAYVNEAHGLGLKVKIYYTVRELSNHVAEMFALRSLGDEVFVDGPGGGGAWLCEHLVSNYTPAWHETLATGEVDAAIATAGLSRWHNYYLEGLGWMLKNVEIDGLYLDGIGYDRQIMKRVRKVLDRNRPGSLIDLHSGNEFIFHDLRISPANKYMEHFPYINSLWFGEEYDYDESADYWLTEISGIPFGLFSEMLNHNGNPWRGMVYGMTARYYQGADPKHIWKVWDDFGIKDAEMIGYWDPSCPVKTSEKDALATVYKKDKRSLISIASWAKGPLSCHLTIDWPALGLNPENAKIFAPPISGFQESASFSPSSGIPLEPGKGWLLIVEEA